MTERAPANMVASMEGSDPDQAASPRKRGGRPPAAHAGEVEARIIAAATRLFLARGFDGTSFDGVAATARAGKASIYARYANKAALFAAVIEHAVSRNMAASSVLPADLPMADRLVAAAASLAQAALQPDAIALMRLIIAEAGRRPDLAEHANAIGRTAGIERMVAAIAPAATGPARAGAITAAEAIIDLFFVPMMMRALLGGDPAELQRDVPLRAASVIEMLRLSGAFAPIP
jgi:AcrR family transcriptional regulator